MLPRMWYLVRTARASYIQLMRYPGQWGREFAGSRLLPVTMTELGERVQNLCAQEKLGVRPVGKGKGSCWPQKKLEVSKCNGICLPLAFFQLKHHLSSP